MYQPRQVNLDFIFGRDDLADYYADRAEELAAERAAIEDDDPEPPAGAAPVAKVVPIWAVMLGAADGRRGVDSRAAKRQRRVRAFARCA